MKKWLRRIRGAVGMGLTWAIAWFGAGVALLLVVGLDAADVPFPLGFGMFGFIAGVMFSGVLGIVEGRRRFDQMSLPRFAGWGAVGGFLLFGTFISAVALVEGFRPGILVSGPVFALAGAASAAGTRHRSGGPPRIAARSVESLHDTRHRAASLQKGKRCCTGSVVS